MKYKRTIVLSVILFVVWTVACAIWYIFSVKGLTTTADAFNGHSNAIAIVEILFMILGSFFIGFIAAYYLQEEPLSQWRNAFFNEEHHKNALEYESKSLQQANRTLQSEKSYMDLHYKSELAKKGQINQQLNATLEGHKIDLQELKAREQNLKTQLSELQPKAEQLDSEVAHLRFRVKQLEFENQNKFELRVPKEDEISDLTQIQGIGPAISRKLYAMGIYSFKQISQFDEKAITQVGKALKYFPDRILRDDWVGQARRLSS